jgi:GntR family transcriptional repressor for pyruvate dehydrogenase complex
MSRARSGSGGKTFINLEAPIGLSTDRRVAERVVRHVRQLIERGALKPGDRLPAERVLAGEIGVSRPSLRAGLRALAAMGVVQARHGSGTYITGGPITLVPEPLRMLAALHGISRDELFEARRLLEVGVAGLAAERATPEQLAAMADEVAGMFAGLGDPHQHLTHDVRFHRAVATAANNAAVGALIEMVSGLFFELRRSSIEHAADLRESAEQHRRIYLAIRARDPEKARQAMTEHLLSAQANQAAESARRDKAASRGSRNNGGAA